MVGSENRQAEASARIQNVMRAARKVAATMADGSGELFKAFCRSAAEQMRAPYVVRHGASKIPDQLVATFAFCQTRSGEEVLAEMTDGGRGNAVLRTVLRDQPFIVDTVRLLLNRAGVVYEGGFHAVIRVERDEDGQLLRVAGEAGELESVAQFELSGVDPVLLGNLPMLLHGNLRLARAMVQDHRAMTVTVDQVASRMARIAARRPDQGRTLLEATEFLRWLLSDNFVFMGLAEQGSSLGFEHPDLKDVWQTHAHDPLDHTGFGDSAVPIAVRKGTIESPVHRAGRVDEIRVQVPHEDGAPSHVLLLRGMFTFRAVTQPSRSVPVLRNVLAEVLQEDVSRPGSWRYKGVANVFDSLPTEYLFTADKEQVATMIDRVLDAESERDTRVFIVQRADDEVTFVLAAMPRRQYNDELRQQMERAMARRIHPHYVHDFFIEAFNRLGGKVNPREKGRYEITYVPPLLMDRNQQIGIGLPVQPRYERICFEKEHVSDSPRAELVSPGHPLLEACISLVMERDGAI